MAKAAKQTKGFKTAGKKRAPRHKNVVSLIHGEEPLFLEIPSLIEMAKALTWYNRVHKTKDLREDVFTWMAKNGYTPAEIEAAKARKAMLVMTDCALARLAHRGSVLPQKTILHLRDRVNNLLHGRVVEEEDDVDEEGNIVEEKAKSKKVSPRVHAERRAERVNAQLIEHIDATIDAMAKGGERTFDTAYSLFNKVEPGPISLQFIADWVQKEMGWINDAYKNPSEYIFTKSQLKAFMALYKDVYDEADKRLNTKKQRKPRKPKARNISKAVSKVRYMAESKIAKVKSVDPTNIIGATEVWVFNETFRKLGVYKAAEGKVLDISRSSIVNFDENHSIEKRCRKPAEVCAQVLTSMKAGLKRILPTIKAQENVLSGRLTPNTVIVRCIK